MKVFLALGLTVVGIFTLNNTATRATQQDQKADPSYKEGLQISLLAPKHRYKRNEKIKLHVMLTNVSYCTPTQESLRHRDFCNLHLSTSHVA